MNITQIDRAHLTLSELIEAVKACQGVQSLTLDCKTGRPKASIVYEGATYSCTAFFCLDAIKGAVGKIARPEHYMIRTV